MCSSDLPNEAREALNSLSGFKHDADRIVSLLVNRQFLRTLFDPVRSIVTTDPQECQRCCNHWLTPWIDIEGAFMNIHGNNYPSLSGNGYNVTMGAQTSVVDHLTIGVAGSYEEDFLHFYHHNGKETCHNWMGGVYTLYRPRFVYGMLDFTFDFSSNHLKRNIEVGSLHYQAVSRPQVSQYTLYPKNGS